MAEAVKASAMRAGLSAAMQQLGQWLFTIFLLGTHIQANGHRLDEYLQAARLQIGHTHLVIELDLTPGVQTAEGVFSQIDIDKDKRLSLTEQEAYAGLIQRALLLELDGKACDLRLTDHDFPDPEALLQGLGSIHLKLEARYRPLASGSHQFHLVNTHRNDIGVYLVNALIPEERGIEIRRQERDVLQRDYRVFFAVKKSKSKRIPFHKTSYPPRSEAMVPLPTVTSPQLGRSADA